MTLDIAAADLATKVFLAASYGPVEHLVDLQAKAQPVVAPSDLQANKGLEHADKEFITALSVPGQPLQRCDRP